MKAILLILFPFVCSAQCLPPKVSTFMSQQQTNGYTMRETDVEIALHDVLQTSFNCIDLGVTCTDLTTSLSNVYPFIGTTLTSQSLSLFRPANDAITWTGSPTANDGSITFNGTTQYGAVPMAGSNFPTGTGAISICIFFKLSSNTNATMMSLGDNTATGTRFGFFYNSAGALIGQCNVAGIQFAWTFDNAWHFLCLTKPAGATPTSMLMYMDGVLKTTTTSSPSTVINIGTTGELAIGKVAGAVINLFPGTLKFPMVWARVLSLAEQSQVFNALKYQVGL